MEFKKLRLKWSWSSQFYTILVLAGLFHIFYVTVTVCVATEQNATHFSVPLVQGKKVQVNECNKSAECQKTEPDHACIEFPSQQNPGLFYKECADCKLAYVEGRPECEGLVFNYVAIIVILGILLTLLIIGLVIGSCCFFLPACPGFRWRQNRKRRKHQIEAAHRVNRGTPGGGKNVAKSYAPTPNAGRKPK